MICAALTGWRGDDPSPWQCPMPAETIVAWGASYLRREDGLDAAFADLSRQGLFHQVLYPIFAAPVYYCSYDSVFVDELPTTIGDWIAGVTISELKEFWDAEFDENGDEFGATWIYWGLCAGQGSQSGSAGNGPCLGPGCCCFTGDKDECHWELPFADVPRTGWPDMRFLHFLADDRLSEERLAQTLRAWRVQTPELPWPPDE